MIRTLCVIAALAGVAHANGRPEATKSIGFRPQHESDIWVGLTFGAIVSHDGGATWLWTCEDAIGYGSEYDPDFAYTASGKVFATAMNKGLVVNTDGCTFAPTQFGTNFATSLEPAANGDLFVAFDDANNGKIYRSTDDGVSFPAGVDPGIPGDNWHSLAIAKSDPSRLYLAGRRFVAVSGGGTVPQFILLRSDTAGASYVPLSQTGLVTGGHSEMEIAGISQTDPDVVFVRVTVPHDVVGDTIYRSVDAGASWTQVLDLGDTTAAFVVRANGDTVAGTPTLGAYVAHDCGKTGACTFTALANPPHTNCFVENRRRRGLGLHAELRPPGPAVRRLRHHEVDRSRDLDAGAALPGHQRADPVRRRHRAAGLLHQVHRDHRCRREVVLVRGPRAARDRRRSNELSGEARGARRSDGPAADGLLRDRWRRGRGPAVDRRGGHDVPSSTAIAR